MDSETDRLSDAVRQSTPAIEAVMEETESKLRGCCRCGRQSYEEQPVNDFGEELCTCGHEMLKGEDYVEYLQECWREGWKQWEATHFRSCVSRL